MMSRPLALDNPQILRTAADWHEQGLGVALASVVSTWGSAPRPVGSLLAVNQRQAFVGSVSGGCIEAEVIEQSLRVMETGTPLLLEFSVSDAQAWAVGLACGGRIAVYLERLE